MSATSTPHRVPSCLSLRVVVLACLITVASAAPCVGQLVRVDVGPLTLVYFDITESYLVPHAVQSFMKSIAFQRRLFGFDPKDRVYVVLMDLSDDGDAGASVTPRNRLSVQIAPLSYAFETIAANDRLILIMNHEMVHVATMGQPANSDHFFRRLFHGKVSTTKEQPESAIYSYLTAPRLFAPRWYHEGIAVFTDTWMDGGIGRAQGGWDEMVFRAKVRDGAPIYDPLGLVSEGTKIDFQLQVNAYLYGARFMTWLARRYSPEKVVEWTSRKEGSRGYYASQFEKVFGRSIESAWAEWVAFEHAFQRTNLESIRKFPVTPTHDLTTRALGSVSRAYYDSATGKLYAAFDYPGVVAHIGAINVNRGTIERIVDVKDPAMYTVTALAFDPDAHRLFYTTDNGALRDLVSLDPDTGRKKLLQKDARIGDLAFDRADKSLWGIRHLSGLATIVRIPPPYTDWKQIYTFPYGTVPYDLDVSPDGRRLVASFGEINGEQNVRLLDVEKLLKGDVTPVAQFDFGPAVVPNNFVFSPDGRFLYGSSYFSGVSNIFRYDIAAGKSEPVTNAETGFFRPVPLGGDDLIVFRYAGQGFVPTRITAKPVQDLGEITFLGQTVVEEHPGLKEWNTATQPPVPYESLEKRRSPYRLAGGLQLESLYPMLQGYKDTQAVGLRVNFSDPLQINRLALTGSYSPAGTIADSERVHLSALYERYDWTINASLNDADFYDLFGPTKVGRKGYKVAVEHKTTLLYDDPIHVDLTLGGNVSGNLDRLPAYQNVPVSVTRLQALDAKLTYTNTTGSLGRVDDEKGQKATVNAEVDHVDGKAIFGMFGTFDQGFPLPLTHSSVWIRSAAGFSPNDATNLFANFYFGGFGNNWVDHQAEKRYRESYAFPGLSLNEVGGRNYAKSMVEWNLPPWRFLRMGKPGFYLTWMRPAIFVGGLATNMDAPNVRHFAADYGGQLDFRFTALSNLDMTFSIGAAAAFERGYGPRRELMVSLRILR